MYETRTIYAPLIGITAAIVASGCATVGATKSSQVWVESCVFVGQAPVSLTFVPAPSKRINLRNTYLNGPDSVEFTLGRDYLIDQADGTLRRTGNSRIPDFQQNILFGQENFDHSKFPGFGNQKFFVFADYVPATRVSWPIQTNEAWKLQRTLERLRNGQTVRVVAFGDSITAGGDATKPEYIFWERWAQSLRLKYPQASIESINGATGGDTTIQGLNRLQEKVLKIQPDLVLIGFGMNDHNINSVSIPNFEKNLETLIERIREATTAEVVLFSAFPPNPKWKFGTHHMEDYADATERVAKSTNCAFADVFNNWQAIAARKKTEDMLGNNINHPNDFGHWIYFRVLEAMGL
jgi:acyl-CoA thioesterase-1